MEHRLSASSLVQQLLGGSYRPMGPALPDGTEIVDPGKRFAFFAPWPWFELLPNELEGSSALGAPFDVALTCPRTDGRDPVLWFAFDEEELDLEQTKPKRLLRSLLPNSDLRIATIERILIDGRPALLAEAHPHNSQDGDLVLLILAPYGHGCVQGRADLPASHADGYRSHVISMLATWRWAS